TLNRKIFINSENPRGRRPVACWIAGKDPKNENNYHLQQESNLIYYGACYYVPAQVRRLPSFHTEASSNENQKYSRYLPCNIILQLPGI
ncbi:hypothetical protein ACNG5F_004801, partial [Escherichia coli]